MKYNTKATKRLSKKFTKQNSKGAKNKARLRKKISFSRKKIVPDFISPIASPYNSNEYLIENKSSPFYDEEDEEDFFMHETNEIFDLDKERIVLKKIDSDSNKINSTCDESEMLDIINDLGKELDKNIGETYCGKLNQ